MEFEIEIRALRFIKGDAHRYYQTLALAEVYIAALHTTIRDVRLVWDGEQFMVKTPRIKGTSAPIVQWYHDGAFARDLLSKLISIYENMGGEMPEAARAIAA